MRKLRGQVRVLVCRGMLLILLSMLLKIELVAEISHLFYSIGTMTKNENDKNRVRFKKHNSGHFNRKVKERKDATVFV